MRSKTSFFNKTLFFKTVARFWPIWFFYLAIWFIVLPLALEASMKWSYDAMDVQQQVLGAASSGGLIICGVFAVLSAMAVWSFLYFTRSASGMASLPIRREGVFASVTLAGIAPLVAINVLVCLITLGFEALNGVAAAGELAQFLAITTLLLVFFYGFSTFCAQLTGNVLVLPLVYVVLNFTAFAVEGLTKSILSTFVFGLEAFGDWKLAFLSPPVRIAMSVALTPVQAADPFTGAATVVGYVFSGWGTLAAYAVVGLAFIAAALLLYRRRRMESAGDVVAIGALRPVFKYCMTGGCALCLGWIIHTVTTVSGVGAGKMADMLLMLLYMLIGAFVGYFASAMLIKKSFRVFKGGWLGFGVSALVMIAFAFAAELDLTGYERRVPSPGEVEYVTVQCGSDFVELRQPENIQMALEAHENIIHHKAWIEDNAQFDPEVTSCRAYLCYHLTNGNLLTRVYYPAYRNGDESTYSSVLELEKLINTREAIASRKITSIAVSADTVIDFSVSSRLTADEYEALTGEKLQISEKDYGYYAAEQGAAVAVPVTDELTSDYSWSFTSEEAEALYYDCILPDIEDGTIGRLWLIDDEDYRETAYSASIYIDLREKREDGNGYNYSYFETTPTTASTRTSAWLAEHGIILHTVAEIGD